MVSDGLLEKQMAYYTKIGEQKILKSTGQSFRQIVDEISGYWRCGQNGSKCSVSGLLNEGQIC